MSTILALILVVVLLLTEHLRRRKKEVPVFARSHFHPGHTWMRETEDGEVVVGIDEFAASFLGEIDALVLPRYLRRMRQGEPSFTLSRANRSITFNSPVSGRIIEKNEMVLRNPSLILSSPLRDGWILKIHPARLSVESRNLLTGEWASRWDELTRSRLMRFFSLSPVPVSQDGGFLTHDLPLRCSDEEWSSLTKELFFTEASPKNGSLNRHQPEEQQ